MGATTKIEWADASWTPVRARVYEIQDDGSGKERIGWHCEHVSEGCRFCYAEGINRRLGTGRDYKPGELYRPELAGYHNGEVKLFLDEKMLLQPINWRKPKRIFVCSMTDLFGRFVPDEMIDRIFAAMALAPQHTFIALTKRPERMRAYVSDLVGSGRWLRLRHPLLGYDIFDPAAARYAVMFRHVWLGVSVEDQPTFDERWPLLRATPAAKRLISFEPLLGPVAGDFSGLDWAIVGGESGPNARPMHPDWARDLRDQCQAAGVPYFFKQWGDWLPDFERPPEPILDAEDLALLEEMFAAIRQRPEFWISASKMLDRAGDTFAKEPADAT